MQISRGIKVVKTQIKLMPDYQCWPLWWAGQHEPGNINPESLLLSSGLIARLQKWSDRYDAQLNIDDPSQSVPLSGQVLKEFEQEGLALWKLLRDELGDTYTVSYFSISE